MDLTESIAPRSDQQNFDDYLTGPRTVTVTEVKAGSAEQPVEVHLAEYPGRPFKPSKSMRRVLVGGWGKDGSVYVGRQMTLVGDPTVRFGNAVVGGVRISHMSDIGNKALNLSLTTTRGKKAPYVVQPLAAEPKPKPTAAVPDYAAQAEALGTPTGVNETWERAKTAGHLTEELKGQLRAIGTAIASRSEQVES